MRDLLEEDDAEAVNYLPEFTASAGGLQFEPEFKRFIKSVENYDFEQALTELEKIRLRES